MVSSWWTAVMGTDNCEFPSPASLLTNSVSPVGACTEWPPCLGWGCVRQGAQEEFGLREALGVSIRGFIRRFDNSIFTNNKPQTTMERHLEEANKLNNHIHIHTNTQYTALNIASYVHIPRYSLSRPLDTQPSLGRTHFSLFGHTSSLRSRRSCFDLPGTLEQFSMERIPSTSDQHDRTPRVQLPMQCSIEHISWTLTHYVLTLKVQLQSVRIRNWVLLLKPNRAPSLFHIFQRWLGIQW